MNNEALETFWYWIREREAMRIKKERGEPRPWTKDHILDAHHFCNVRREDDRGTKEIRALAKGIHLIDLPWWYTAARMLNYAPSIKILNESGWDGVKKVKERGGKIFHTAYVVSTCGKKMDKVDYVVGVVGDVSEIKLSRNYLQEAYEALLTVDGLGSFMAGQVVADLKNDRYLVDAPDWWSWSSPGPGSLKGLSYIFERTVTKADYEYHMEKLLDEMPMGIIDMKIHNQDLQNCLCEFSKYWRYKAGLHGRVRYYK